MTTIYATHVLHECPLLKLLDYKWTSPRITNGRPPGHPRTKKNLDSNGLLCKISNTDAIKLTEPIGYISFMNLVFNCKMVITDSGGLQEETTYLGIPCFTLRNNTERPITITQGTNRLCTSDNLLNEMKICFDGRGRDERIPNMWDGNTAHRISKCIRDFFIKTSPPGELECLKLIS